MLDTVFYSPTAALGARTGAIKLSSGVLVDVQGAMQVHTGIIAHTCLFGRMSVGRLPTQISESDLNCYHRQAMNIKFLCKRM